MQTYCELQKSSIKSPVAAKLPEPFENEGNSFNHPFYFHSSDCPRHISELSCLILCIKTKQTRTQDRAGSKTGDRNIRTDLVVPKMLFQISDVVLFSDVSSSHDVLHNIH